MILTVVLLQFTIEIFLDSYIFYCFVTFDTNTTPYTKTHLTPFLNFMLKIPYILWHILLFVQNIKKHKLIVCGKLETVDGVCARLQFLLCVYCKENNNCAKSICITY